MKRRILMVRRRKTNNQCVVFQAQRIVKFEGIVADIVAKKLRKVLKKGRTNGFCANTRRTRFRITCRKRCKVFVGKTSENVEIDTRSKAAVVRVNAVVSGVIRLLSEYTEGDKIQEDKQ